MVGPPSDMDVRWFFLFKNVPDKGEWMFMDIFRFVAVIRIIC